MKMVEITKELCEEFGGKWDERLSEDNCTMPGEINGLHKVHYLEVRPSQLRTRSGKEMTTTEASAEKFFKRYEDAHSYATGLTKILQQRGENGAESESVQLINVHDGEVLDQWDWELGEIKRNQW